MRNLLYLLLFALTPFSAHAEQTAFIEQLRHLRLANSPAYRVDFEIYEHSKPLDKGTLWVNNTAALQARIDLSKTRYIFKDNQLFEQEKSWTRCPFEQPLLKTTFRVTDLLLTFLDWPFKYIETKRLKNFTAHRFKFSQGDQTVDACLDTVYGIPLQVVYFKNEQKQRAVHVKSINTKTHFLKEIEAKSGSRTHVLRFTDFQVNVTFPEGFFDTLP